MYAFSAFFDFYLSIFVFVQLLASTQKNKDVLFVHSLKGITASGLHFLHLIR